MVHKRVKAKKILVDISATSQDTWGQVKAGIEQGWTDLTRTAKIPWRKFAKPSPNQSTMKKFARSPINSGSMKVVPTDGTWNTGSRQSPFGAHGRMQLSRIDNGDPKPSRQKASRARRTRAVTGNVYLLAVDDATNHDRNSSVDP